MKDIRHYMLLITVCFWGLMIYTLLGMPYFAVSALFLAILSVTALIQEMY